MRILLATTLPGGGPLEHSLVLARGLASRGVAVEASCASAELAARFEAAGATPHVLPLERTADLRGGARLRALTRGFDVVHAQDRRAGLWTRLGPAPRPPLRVYTVHGLPDPYLPIPANRGRRPDLRDRLAYRGLDAWLARRSDAVVVPSHALAEQLRTRLGFPAERMHVVPNGIEPAPRLGGGELVASVSLLGPVKGLDSFVRAVAALGDAEEAQGTRFAIFGDGPERPRLEALARQLGAPFEFPGHVPIAEVLPQLRLYVLCSWFENCPMSLLEAMAAGVPALATAVGGVPEMVDDTVPLVPPGDHEALADGLRELLAEPARTAERAARARARVEREFSAENNAGALLDLYRGLLEAR